MFGKRAIDMRRHRYDPDARVVSDRLYSSAFYCILSGNQDQTRVQSCEWIGGKIVMIGQGHLDDLQSGIAQREKETGRIADPCRGHDPPAPPLPVLLRGLHKIR